jgi:hypothetical protein
MLLEDGLDLEVDIGGAPQPGPWSGQREQRAPQTTVQPSADGNGGR